MISAPLIKSHPSRSLETLITVQRQPHSEFLRMLLLGWRVGLRQDPIPLGHKN